MAAKLQLAPEVEVIRAAAAAAACKCKSKCKSKSPHTLALQLVDAYICSRY